MVQENNKTWYAISVESELQKEANLKYFLLINALMLMVDTAFLDWYFDKDPEAATVIVNEMQTPEGQEAYTKAKEIAEKVDANTAAPQEKAVFDEASDTVAQLRSKEAESHDEISLDALVEGILAQEGLLPRQLPVRITNPAMRNWTTYLGFELDHAPKPEGRENFLFLKKQEDLIPAIKRQLMRYQSHPNLFSLSESPTLEEAIRKFDQSNPEGKMKYLKQQFPSIDFSKPLVDYLGLTGT